MRRLMGYPYLFSAMLPTLAAMLLAVSVAPMTECRGADAPKVPEAVLKAEQQRIDAIAKATRASICVFMPGGKGGGSGVVITPDGYALTNFHVAMPAGVAMKCSMPDGKLYDTVVVAYDPTGDVTLIKLLGRKDFPTTEMGDSDTVRAGQWCFAIGNPFLLATNFQPSVSWGIVSGVHRYQYPAKSLLEYTDCIQTDAAINPGNSGGPLFNSQGQLIGINGRGSFEKRGRVNVGVGYAISINQIKHFLGYLRSGRIIDHAILNVQVATMDGGGVEVTSVAESSDAYRRGLREGDQILEFGGRAVHTTNEFLNVQGIFPAGWRVPMTYSHEGEVHHVLVRLRSKHAEGELVAKIQKVAKPKGGHPKMPQMPRRPKKNAQPKKGDKPGPKKRLRMMPPPRGKPVPPVVAKVFKAKYGYTNYYFNKLNRDRIWKANRAQGNFTKLHGEWTLSGKLKSGGAVKIVLSDSRVVATLDGKEFSLDLKKDINEQLAPKESGGLLAALYLWRHLLVNGPEKFEDTYYLGTAPMRGRGGKDHRDYLNDLVDVLVASYRTTACHFQFDPKNGQLLGLEYFAEEDQDPCEIFFADYRKVDGRRVPHTIKVLHGDDVYGEIQIKELTFTAAKK